jgi:formylglycine-generating enzyme required for sulfatase activity
MKNLFPGITASALATLCLAGVVARSEPSVAATGAPPARWTNSLGMVFVPLPGTNVSISVWETRVRDFEAFMETGSHDLTESAWVLLDGHWRQGRYSWRDPGFDQTRDHPVCAASWEDSVAFCQWLTEKERSAGTIRSNQQYRLPRDIEWTSAAGTDRYPAGPELAAALKGGNYAGAEVAGRDWFKHDPILESHRDDFVRTAPVGRFQPNPLGLYDLGGNVAEWCEDPYRKSMTPPDLQQEYAYLSTSEAGRLRVLRGGSWFTGDPDKVRADHRLVMKPRRQRYTYLGFRCVLDFDAPVPSAASGPNP